MTKELFMYTVTTNCGLVSSVRKHLLLGMPNMEDAWNTAAGISNETKHWLEERNLLWIQGTVPATHKGPLATAFETLHNVKKLST